MFRGLWQRMTRAVLLVVVVLVGSSAQGAEPSLQLVPADAGFYSAMLRNKEQVDLLVNSKAFKSVLDLPQVQMGLTALHREYNKKENEQFRQVVESPLGKEVIGLLSEAVSEEIFLYGSDTLGDTLHLASTVYTNVQMGPLTALIEGKAGGLNQEEIQGYYALKALATNLPLVKIPDLVIGFKLKDTARAEKLLALAEEQINEALKKAPPPAQGRFKRTAVGKSNLLTVNLDGSLVPWQQIPIRDLEQKDGEFTDLIATLKKLTLTISLGVHEGYLVVGIGPSTEPVARLAPGGNRLKDQPEFKLLAKVGTNKLTDISYSSKVFATKAAQGNEEQLAGILEVAKKGLEIAPLPEDQKTKLKREIDNSIAGIKKLLPTPGATLAFNFTTPRGSEGYAYDWTSYPGEQKPKPLTLLSHVGGSPILAGVLHTGSGLDEYKSLAQFVRMMYGLGLEYAANQIPDEDNKKRFSEITKALEGLGKKFDTITVEQLYPSTADGQLGVVLDAKWTSKEWARGLPTEKPMPMLEIGLLMGLSDGDKFVQAMTGYRKLVNEFISEFGRLVPEANVPPALELPPPEKKADAAGSLYFYPLGDVGLDKQFQPMFGIGKNAGVLALSQGHTSRLLAPTPLKVDGGPLAGRLNQPLLSASYADMPALVDAITPWIEFSIRETLKQGAVDKNTVEDSLKSFQTVVKVLKCIKVSTTATYKEDGATVTHAETVIKDIE